MRNNIKKQRFILVLIIAITLIVLWITGVIGIWTDGISYVANNTKEFTDSKSHNLDGEYSISIDLSNLESNIGKELYNDGKHRIYVYWIDNTGSVSTGGFRIVFRARGNYTITNASLISGVHHVTVNAIGGFP